MKTIEKKESNAIFDSITIDRSLNDKPLPAAAQRKLEEAREFLKKHPIPEEILRGRR